MAVAITAAAAELYDTNLTDSSGGLAALGSALAADPEAARLYQPRPRTFTVGATSTASGETQSLAANQLVNFTAKGVPFPASSSRTIRTKAWFKQTTGSPTAPGKGYVEQVFTVGVATTTPVLSVTPTNVTATTLGAAPVGNMSIVALRPGGTATTPLFPLLTINVSSTALVVGGVSFANQVYLSIVSGVAQSFTWYTEVTVEPLVII